MKRCLFVLFSGCVFVCFLFVGMSDALAWKSCRSGFRTYKHGNYRCTLGRKDQCLNGRWKYKGKCGFFGRFCHYGSKNFTHGKLRCTSGKRYQCRKGRWKYIGKCTSGGKNCRSGFRTYKHGQYRCTLGRKDQCWYGAWVYRGKCGLFGQFCHIGGRSYKTGVQQCFRKKGQSRPYFQKCHPGKFEHQQKAFWQTMWGTPYCCNHNNRPYRQGQKVRKNSHWYRCSKGKWVW
ncbi:MAG TPA: hypothetical protein DCE42_18810 [Myxococcales bacterium]|nr:hypothetical protein [Deltaproteobacteria bacterium]HAA56825.1 hypothetical protein [Myxococcales bacterium]